MVAGKIMWMTGGVRHFVQRPVGSETSLHPKMLFFSTLTK
jgi:hypothetical protein